MSTLSFICWKQPSYELFFAQISVEFRKILRKCIGTCKNFCPFVSDNSISTENKNWVAEGTKTKWNIYEGLWIQQTALFRWEIFSQMFLLFSFRYFLLQCCSTDLDINLQFHSGPSSYNISWRNPERNGIKA